MNVRELRSQPGLRRVLEAVQKTASEIEQTSGAPTDWRDTCGNIIYLADFRNRARSLNEPTDPRPGAAAARPVELSFLSAIARPTCAVFQVSQPQSPTRHVGAMGVRRQRGRRSLMARGGGT